MSSGSPPPVRRHRLQPPALGPGDVERPRLTSAILATPDSGTCILSAPPGYGVTTSLAQALAGDPGVAWVSLDEFDATPAHLHAQLVAAVSSSSRDPWPAPTDAGSDVSVLGLTAPFVEALSQASISWIVLDGLDAAAHAALMPAVSYLAMNTPPGIRVALTTHDSPRLIPVAASDRRLVLIEAEQLQATDEEAARVVLATTPDLDVDAIEDITAAAHGLVAAVRAAARHAERHPSDSAGHWLLAQGASVLLGPWLDSIPAAWRRFLEATAFLERLSGPLCDAALEAQGSLEILLELESHGAYLTPVQPARPGDTARWWSRHPLLTAALHQRGAVAGDPDRDLRAAAWFEGEGDLESTMRHLLAAGRLEQAAAVLKGEENALFESGRGERAAEWYAALPPTAWGQVGWHLLRVGWGQAVSSDSSAGMATLAELRAHLATSRVDESEQRVLGAEVATLAAYLASLAGDTRTTITNALTAMDQFGELNSENSLQIAPVLLIRSLLWNGEVAAARRELERVRFQPFPTGVLREVAVGSLKGQCLLDEGCVTQARIDIDRALQWLAGNGLVANDVGLFGVLTAQGAATLESGDCLTAIAQLESAAESAFAKRNHGDGVHALLWLARARICAGQPAQALAEVKSARRALNESAPTSELIHRVDLTEAFVRHVGGDSVRAERLLQRVPASEARALMWARVTMHRQSNSLRRSLTPLDTDSPRTAVDKQVLLAMLTMKRSNALAEGHLLRAADLAEVNGLHLGLLGGSVELLNRAQALAVRTSHDFLATMVRSIGGGTEPRSRPAPTQPETAMAAAGPRLSPGELELITFLPRRDSNAEIAAQLGVSVNTIKTRMYRLYRKLGVESRGQAIETARARGLIT